MPDLNDDQKQKLEEMLETWDNVHRAIKALNFIGGMLKWIIGIGASLAMIWGVLHGQAPK